MSETLERTNAILELLIQQSDSYQQNRAIKFLIKLVPDTVIVNWFLRYFPGLSDEVKEDMVQRALQAANEQGLSFTELLLQRESLESLNDLVYVVRQINNILKGDFKMGPKNRKEVK